MFTQETVFRLSAEDKQSDDSPLGALAVWSTAEGYYRAKGVSQLLLADAATIVEAGSEHLDGAPAGQGANTNPHHTVETQDAENPGDQVAATGQMLEDPEPITAYDASATQASESGGSPGVSHPDAQLHPRELVQDDFPPTAAIGVPDVEVPEREPAVVHTLPPPPKPTSIGESPGANGPSDRPKRPDYARTRIQMEPPASHHPVPPVRPVLPFYEGKRYLDPAVAVQRRAQMRADERRRRIEAWKWLGQSPSRPSVSATPFMEGNSGRPAAFIIPYYVVHDRD